MTREQLVALLRSWQDYFPFPPTWTGELQRRSTERGPAPFRVVECPECEGRGKRGNWTCARCKGEGVYAVDDYTSQPVDTAETPWSQLLAGAVNCDRCGGWGRLGAYAEARPDRHTARLCDKCEGTGKVSAMFSRRGGDGVESARVRHGDRTLDALADQAEFRDGQKPFQLLAAAMDELHQAWPPTHFLVCWVFVFEVQQPSARNWRAIEFGLDFLLERLHDVPAPAMIRRQIAARQAALVRAKGKSADPRARARRDDEIRRRRADGASIDALAAEFDLDKSRVSRICSGKR